MTIKQRLIYDLIWDVLFFAWIFFCGILFGMIIGYHYL